MATGKVLGAANSSFSLSGGFKNIFSCCFSSLTPTASSGKGAANLKNEESAYQVVGVKDREGTDEQGAKEVREEGRLAGGEEERIESRAIGLIYPSDQDSAIVYEEFRDSAIDTASLNSQFNVRGSVDGETMKMNDNLDLDEESSLHGNRNGDSEEQYATQFEQESNDDVTIFDTSFGRIEDGDGEGGEGLDQGDADDVYLPVAEAEVDHLDPMTGDPGDATGNVANADLAHPAIIQCGRVRVTLAYDTGRQRLTLIVHEASDMPDYDRVNLSHSQVHLLLLPATKKIRHRTKNKSGENPQFEDTFRVKIPTDELYGNGFRLRLYGSEKFKKERMIGENYVSFSSCVPFDKEVPYSAWIKLQPRININVIGDPKSEGAPNMDIDGEDEKMMSYSPSSTGPAVILSSGTPLELMLGMAYNLTTGRLSVEVVQGSNIKSPDSQKPPDTFVKLSLIAPNGQEITRCKTTLRRSQPNPLYKETFMFHVPQFQLPDVSLMVSVFEHRSIKHSKMLGWFTLGHTNSTDETKQHWMAMIESKGEQIVRWQTLLSP